MHPNLPIEAALPAIHDALKERGIAVLQAPPGAGKTTRLPMTLLDRPWLRNQRILLLEPRRLVVTSVASFLARQRQQSAGEDIGYRIRFETRVTARTRLEVMTTGVFLRLLQQDPALEGVGLVIFDEFHERSLDVDLALALTLESRGMFRDDLKLLVMSATLDAEPVSQLLADAQGPAPLITVEGRSYPVETHHLSREPDGPLSRTLPPLIQRALQETRGSVLVFLPGQAEIRSVQRALDDQLTGTATELLPLYGDLPLAQQQSAMNPPDGGKRRVILATSLAETALTLPDIQAVVDSGWRREPRFDPISGMTRLETVPVSQASAKQRRGRAGRVSEGHCYRLYTESGLLARPAQTLPEISSADLAPLVLELALWGTPAEDLRWLTAPPPPALSQARNLLLSLGALLPDGRISDSGKAMQHLPLPPRLAHMVVESGRWRARSMACRLAALISERDFLRQGRDADLRSRLAILDNARDEGSAGGNMDRQALKRIREVIRQFDRLSQSLPTLPELSHQPSDDELPGLLLALAYPDRIAQARAPNSTRYRLSQGRGARLDENDRLVGEPWLVVAALDGHAREARIYLAAAISAPALQEWCPELLRQVDRFDWDDSAGAVIAQREIRLGELVVETEPLSTIDPERLSGALSAGIRRRGLLCLPWSEELRHWQQRVLYLHSRNPESFPDLCDRALLETLEEWLAPWLAGYSRLSHLSRLNLTAALHNLLTHEQQRALERHAPASWVAPTGTRVRVEYPEGAAPFSEVRLQEVFGQAKGPVLGNNQPILLHLLSPARRPIAVTDNLARFWEVGYPDVRKDMRGRYPRHPWPENPLLAEPTRRAKPRPQ